MRERDVWKERGTKERKEAERESSMRKTGEQSAVKISQRGQDIQK